MASSLDDRPDYEALQDELDRAAKLWVNGHHYPSSVLQLLNHYIEYLCSELLLDRSVIINETHAEEYIRTQDLSVWEFKEGLEARKLILEFTKGLKLDVKH